MPWKSLVKTFLNKFIFTISIRSRLLLYFLLMILLPTAIISITIYYKSTDIITRNINHSLEEKLDMINVNILQKMESINDITTEIYLNPDLVSIISSSHPYDTTEIINEMSFISKLLSNYTITGNARTLLFPRLYMFNRPEYLLYSFTEQASDTSLIERQQWYLNLPPSARYTVTGTDHIIVSDKSIPTIKFAKKIFGLDDMNLQFAGVLTIDMGIDYFREILHDARPTAGSSSFIMDRHNSVIISTDTSVTNIPDENEVFIKNINTRIAYSLGSYITHENGADMLVAYKKIEPLDWVIVSITPMSELNRELIGFNRLIIIVIAISGILAVLVALLLSDNISYPIRKLMQSMRVVQGGNFDISLEYKRNDEFAYLFNTYKKMVREIKELIDKLYISELNKKEADLKTLQAQINPHFLYNTLDSVNWMALELDAKNISTTVTSLSNFFRYSLSGGKSIISLMDEFKQVENYLMIQKIRFQERLEYDITIPAEIHGYLTVKLILQPIVENAILHGINKIRGKGLISISGCKIESNIEITISDNGAGADVDELNAILNEKSQSTSFAIKNVNDRIKHYFGNEFGIRFDHNEPQGTTVVIRFPAVKTMEGR